MPTSEVAKAETHPTPRHATDLFVAFTALALQGFGGVMAVAHRELVEKRKWMTDAEFAEDVSVAQLMPGPNICNLSLMLGGRYFGVRGALAALAGLLVVPSIIILLVAIAYAQYADHPAVTDALRGMGAVAGGMMAAVGLRLLKPLASHPVPRLVNLALGVGCFVMIAVLRWPLLYVLTGLGMISCALTYRRLGP